MGPKALREHSSIQVILVAREYLRWWAEVNVKAKEWDFKHLSKPGKVDRIITLESIEQNNSNQIICSDMWHETQGWNMFCFVFISTVPYQRGILDFTPFETRLKRYTGKCSAFARCLEAQQTEMWKQVARRRFIEDTIL